jgi:PGF-pre-PGF domain-containing protein
MAVGKIVEVNMSGLNASNESEVGSVIITMYYNKADLDLNGDGIIGPDDLDEDYLFIYWLNTTNGNWTKLLKDNPAWVIDSGRTKISGSSGNVWVKVRHLSTFGIAAGLVPKLTDDKSNYNPGSGGGGGGGCGGGGSSGENYSNIEMVEKYDMQISKDALTSYRFTHSKNPIMFVNITGNTSLGIITASIEVLKNTSTLVNDSPEGLVYKNANIWVGTSGYATPKNIKQALIKFRVDNEWMSSNGVSGSDVVLVKWDGSAWMKLETSESAKDDTYTYYEAKTQTFSSFAIIGLKGEKSEAVYTAVVTETPAKPTSTPTTVPTKGMPGFEIVTAIAAIYMLCRKRK